MQHKNRKDKFPSHASVERELNEAFDKLWEEKKDQILEKWKDHVDKLNQELLKARKPKK